MACSTTDAPGTDRPGETRATMQDGVQVIIRPIRPEDERMMAQFHQTLSLESVYTRYFGVLKLSQRISHERLGRVCHPDPGREAVLVAEAAAAGGARQIVGVGRLARLGDGNGGEIALILRDSHQHRGLGTELYRRLIAIAKDWRLPRIYAHVLPGNVAMLRLCANAGMRWREGPCGSELVAELAL
jgi:acetyltransferase